MFHRALRLPLQTFKPARRMNSVVRSHEDGAITLVDFRLPAKDTEVIQNLVNDEIISTSIIGNSWFFRCVTCRVVFT
jgi:hypothetical protein